MNSRRVQEIVRFYVTIVTIITMLLSPVGRAMPVKAAPGDFEIYASGLQWPFGMDFDASGNLFVAEEAGGSGPSVTRIAPDHSTQTLVSGRSGTSGVAFNSSGVLYLSDNLNEVSRVIDGNLEVVIPSTEGLGDPIAIAFDQDDTLYVLSAAGWLSTYTADGTLIEDRLLDSLNMPQGLAIDNVAHAVYISDANGNITRLDLQTGLPSLWLETNMGGSGLTIDAAGDLYMALSGNQVVKIDHQTATYSTCVSGVDSPRGLALDANGVLYISTYNQGMVWKVEGCGVTLPVVPAVVASVRSTWVNLRNFTPNSQLNLTLLQGETSLFSGQYTTDTYGTINFNRDEPPGMPRLAEGMTLRVQDVTTGITKQLYLVPITVDGIDYTTRTIWGTAPANASLQVQVHDYSNGQSYPTTSDGSGAWSFVLPAEVSLFPGVQNFSVEMYDSDGDGIHADPYMPLLFAGLVDDWVNLQFVNPGDTVTVEILSGEQSLYAGSFTADEEGNVWVGPGEHHIDLQPGMTVTVNDGDYPVQRSITLPTLNLLSVDVAQNLVNGTADPELPFVIQMNGPGFGAAFPITAGLDGAWSFNPGDHGITLTEDIQVTANYFTQNQSYAYAKVPPQPFLQVSLTSDWINGLNFPTNANVAISIYDPQDNLVFGPQNFTKNEWGNIFLDRGNFMRDLVAGYRVAAEDTALGISREIVLEHVSIDAYNYDTDAVFGTAPAGRTVHVGFSGPAGGLDLDVVADANGEWWVDLTSHNYDLNRNVGMGASVEDADGDQSLAQPLQPLQIEASLTNGWVHLRNFSPNGVASMWIDEETNFYTGQVDAWGNVEYRDYEIHYPLVPGTIIHVVDQATGRSTEMVLGNITLDEVDYAQSTIRGTAPAGATVRVEAGNYTGSAALEPVTDAEGNWLADFKTVPFTLSFSSWMNARIFDLDGNTTFAEPAPSPFIEVSPVYDWINLWGFPADTQVAITILPEGGGDPVFQRNYTTSSTGDAWIESWDHMTDLTPGMTVQASVEAQSILKEFTIPVLSVGEVDYDNDLVHGRGEPGLNLVVTMHQGNEGGVGDAGALVDSNGDWTADFGAQEIDIMDWMWPGVRYYDADGDRVFAEPPPVPHIDMWLDGNSVSAYEFPIGASLTLTIDDGAGGTYTDTQINGRSDWAPGQGFYQFQLGEDFTLQPGDSVIVTDGLTTRTSTVASLPDPVIDVNESTLTGTTVPGAQVWCNLCNNQGCANRTVIADLDGNYVIDFDAPGMNPGEEQTVTLQPGDGSSINVGDGQGNNTSRSWYIHNPTISSNRLNRWVHANDWPQGTTLYLAINGQEAGTAVVGPAEWNPNEIVAQWSLQVPPQVGDTLLVSDTSYAGGGATRTLVVSPLEVTAVDTVNDTISGVASPNAWLQVCADVPDGCVMRNVQAGEDGTWTTNVSNPGPHPDDFGTIDLEPGGRGWVGEWDDDRDQNQADWHVFTPSITASAQGNWINARDWPKGTTLYLTIDGVEIGTAVMEQAPWNPNDPNDIVANWNPDPAVQVGDTLVVSDVGYGGGAGAATRTMVVSSLQITNIDLTNSTVHGTANPNSWLQVCANIPNDCALRNVQADAEGNWSAAFATPGSHENDHNTTVFELGVNGWAANLDEQGNQTWYDWNLPRPYVYADVENHWVQTRDWARGTTVYLQINGVPAGSTVVEQAPWNPNDPNDIVGIFNLPEETAMAVGDTISVSNTDESIVKELLLTSLAVTNIDLQAATISGTATASAWVQVCINTDTGCVMRNVLADPDGMWTAEFAVPGVVEGDQGLVTEIEGGMSGWAAEHDEDGDQTWRDWWLPNPHLDAHVDRNYISAFDWPVGTELTFTVTQPEGPSFTGTAVSAVAPWNPNENYADVYLPEGYTVTAGQLVTITGAGLTRTHTIRELPPVTVDAENSQLSGTAPEGSNIWSFLCIETGCYRRGTGSTVGSSGTYVLDYSVPGSNEDDDDSAHPFRPGDGGSVFSSDPDGNNTTRDWGVPNYSLHVNVHDQELHGHDWPIGSQVTITINDPAGPSYTDTVTVAYEPESCGQPCFNMADTGWTLAPGQVVIMTDGSITKTVVASTLAITNIDPLHDQIGGIADPGSTVVVNIQSQNWVPRFVEVDENGEWLVDFSVHGTWETEEIADLVAGDFGRALQFNPGGNNDDGTLENWGAGPAFELTFTNNDENIPAASVVASIHPLFPTPSTYSYSLVAGEGDADNIAFTISGTDLILNESPDYETQNTYFLRLRMQDTETGQSSELAFVLEIDNLNEAPTDISLSNASVDENVAAGSTVGVFAASDPDSSETFTYTLPVGVADNAAFAISGDALSFIAAPNYELKSSYTIRARVTDAGGLLYEEEFIITVSDLNEAPTDISLSSTSINENVAAGSTVGTFSATDPEAGSFSYNLATGVGDTDNAAFAISGNTLSFIVAPNYEVKSSYAIRVRVTDSLGSWYEEAFTITVSDLNETPVDIALSSASANENIAAGSTIGTLSATDPDSGQTFTFTLAAGSGDTDNTAFTITGNALRINASPNFEAENSYAVRVRVTDGGGLFYEESFTITINDLNEAPTDIALSSSSINENVAAGSTVGTFTAVDPDGAVPLTYTLVAGAGDTDNNAFTVTGGTLRINASPNFEAKNSYTVRVRVADGGGLLYEEPFSITINNVNESPTDITLSSTSINENVAAGSTVGTFGAADPDSGQTFTFTLAAGAGDTDNTAFTITAGALNINASPDFETKSSYAIRVRVTDGGGLSYDESFTITINNVAEGATDIALSSSSVDENVAPNTTIGTLSASGSGAGQTFNFSLVSGTGSTNNASFAISGNTLRITASPNYEVLPSYSIRVRATDSVNSGLFFDKVFTITVNNLNEAPSTPTLSTAAINENAAAGSTVGSFSATDPDTGQSLTYALVTGTGDTDNTSFSISGNALTINAAPNYEAKPSYSIHVRVSDNGSPQLSAERQFTITINNVNEAPTDISLSSASINENVAANTTVGTLSAADPDSGQTFAYALAAGGADNAAFTLSGNTLRIAASPNYETKPSYAIRVRVTDGGGLSFEENFTITVNDLNEATTDITLSATSINENVAAGSAVGTLGVADPDGGQTYTYALVTGGADNAAFTITGNTLSINASPNFEAKSSYAIRVRVSDGGLSFEKAFTITVNNLNEAPTNITLSASSVNENVAAGSSVGAFTASDPDSGQTFTYTLVAGAGDADNAAFTIATGALRINASPDFETKASYSVRVRVTDNGVPALTYDEAMTVTINDMNDKPDSLSFSGSSIVENAAADARVIGDFSATDPDLPAQNFTYSLVFGSGSADNGAFAITGTTLSIKAAPDYETKSSYTIRVRVTDSGSPAAFLERVFTISVTNQVEPPVVASFNKTGLQDDQISFTAGDFSGHFAAVESTGTGILENIQITALPAHGALKVGSGPDLTAGSVVSAAELSSLVYVPQASYSGPDSFSWNGADSTGYAGSPAQVYLTIGFVAKYGVQVSPAGDAKSVKPGTAAAYTLSLTNTGNISDGYTIALVGAPKWATTITPSSVSGLAASALTTFSVSVAVPAGATGSDEAVVKITSTHDASKTISVRLTTSAIAAPVVPLPVLFSASPAVANFSNLNGVRLTLSGANFTDPMRVTIGGQQSPSVTRTNSGELVASLPANMQPGTYDVEVCNTYATPKCAGLAGGFTILNNTPMVSGMYPNQGYNDAANTVAFQGFNLGSTITFTLVGADPANQPVVTNASASQVVAVIPAGLPSGTYDLEVCNQALCSTLVSAYTALDVIKNDFSAANEDLWTSPATVREGNTILLGLNVHRLSGMGLAQAEVAFYVNDPSDPANKIGPELNPATSMMAPGSVEAVTASWTPLGLTGAVKIYAVIDPDGVMTEATKANNTVSTTIQILPREEKDETAPIITALSINGGAASTSSRTVNLSLAAADNTNGTGVQTMNIIEREYNTSARQWVVVQETGWIAYDATPGLTLSEQGGVHYVQAWVADGAGNTSEMAQARINYEPPTDSVAAGQVRVYRLELTAGEAQHILLETLTGDADLYVWDPDGSLVASSLNADEIDRVDFTAGLSGLYQVEVYGYVDSTYSIDFTAPVDGPALAQRMMAALDKTPRSTPTILTENEPLNNTPTNAAPISAEPDTYLFFIPMVNKKLN